MILRFVIITAAIGLLSIGGPPPAPKQKKIQTQENKSIKIIKGVQYIDFKTPIIIKPSI